MMNDKITKFLNDNRNWPIIIEGLIEIPNSITINADMPSCELCITPDLGGLVYPEWINLIINKSKSSEKIILLIKGLDEVNSEEQEKFYGMIKYKSINGFKFPQNLQIVMMVKDAKKVSQKISKLALIFKVE